MENTFCKVKAKILFQLEGLKTPIQPEEVIILPRGFAQELLNLGSVEMVEE